MQEDIVIQREYYRKTAADYDCMHVSQNDEHHFALAILNGFIHHLQVSSVLDIGSGTGRAPLLLKASHPGLNVIGVEPSPELRARGYAKGLLTHELIDGDAQKLAFKNEQFDLVCEFGALHHIPNPNLAVSEMLRVAKKAIFISDSNNFGQGSTFVRALKRTINLFGLWPLADF